MVSPVQHESAEKFYLVCDHCTAKFYSDNDVEKCPRCDAVVRSTERHVPPWSRFQVDLEPAIQCGACKHRWLVKKAWRDARVEGFDSFSCPRCGQSLQLTSCHAVVAVPNNSSVTEHSKAPMRMAPYFANGDTRIYCGDCREVLPLLELKADLVVTDPPYSNRTHNGARTNRIRSGGVPLVDFAPMSCAEIRRVFSLCAQKLQRGWLLSFLDWRYVASLEEEPPGGLRFVRHGLWIKPNGAPQLSGDRPAMGWEAIAMLHSAAGRMRWNGGGERAVFECPREHHALHPAQKPLRLLKRLVALFASEGDTVLDPFAGSGTTLRAAKDVGCPAVGIEKEERYCEIAANRLRQSVLF